MNLQKSQTARPCSPGWMRHRRCEKMSLLEICLYISLRLPFAMNSILIRYLPIDLSIARERERSRVRRQARRCFGRTQRGLQHLQLGKAMSRHRRCPGYADWERPMYPKTTEQRSSLTEALQQCPLFQGIEPQVPWKQPGTALGWI